MTLEDTLRSLVEVAVAKHMTAFEAKIDHLASLLEKQSADLVPLEAIRGGNAKAANEFLRRHHELRALGVRVGKRLLFRRSEVERYFREGGQ